jgi:hypothetical protein
MDISSVLLLSVLGQSVKKPLFDSHQIYKTICIKTESFVIIKMLHISQLLYK